MKTDDEILERLHTEILNLGTAEGHLASLARGWIDALEWVLGRDD